MAHSEVNPNTRVMNSRGIWLAYVISVGVLHIVLLSIPFFSVPVVWTLTNVIHNLVSQNLARSSPRAGKYVGWCSPGMVPCPPAIRKPLVPAGHCGKGWQVGIAGGDAADERLLAWATAVRGHKVHFCPSSRLSLASFTSPPLKPTGHVLASAHSEGDPLRDPGPGQGSPPHTLGADRLRDAVHLVTQVPQHLPSSAVSITEPGRMARESSGRCLRHAVGPSGFCRTATLAQTGPEAPKQQGAVLRREPQQGTRNPPSAGSGEGGSNIELTQGLPLSRRYLLTSFYTKYDPVHFVVNTASLLSVLLPKLPQFHGVRVFGINKY